MDGWKERGKAGFEKAPFRRFAGYARQGEATARNIARYDKGARRLKGAQEARKQWE